MIANKIIVLILAAVTTAALAQTANADCEVTTSSGGKIYDGINDCNNVGGGAGAIPPAPVPDHRAEDDARQREEQRRQWERDEEQRRYERERDDQNDRWQREREERESEDSRRRDEEEYRRRNEDDARRPSYPPVYEPRQDDTYTPPTHNQPVVYEDVVLPIDIQQSGDALNINVGALADLSSYQSYRIKAVQVEMETTGNSKVDVLIQGTRIGGIKAIEAGYYNKTLAAKAKITRGNSKLVVKTAGSLTLERVTVTLGR